MLLGCKIQPELFESSEKYRKYILNFDVLYVNSWIYYDLDKLDIIYKFIHDNGKEMYGYYLFSSRWATPKLDRFKIKEIKDYLVKIVSRYPLINKWELCHEDFSDDGKQRKGNKYYRELGNDWKTFIYKIAKNEFSDKKFYYGDYIRSRSKADKIAEFINNTKECSGFNLQIHSDIINPISPKFIKDTIKKINIEKEILFLETIVWQNRDFKSIVSNYKSPTIKEISRDLLKKFSYNILSIRHDVLPSLQAYRYKQYKKIAKKMNVSIFGVWCLTDIHPDAWNLLAFQDKPGLLDINLNEKICYSRIFE